MYKLFIGRWAPFHAGHKYIIDSYVNNGQKVCIAIRDTKLSEKDPFSFELRKKLIENYYKDNKNVEIIKVPDIDMVCTGRDVGYALSQVPESIENISGTKERQKENNLFNDGQGCCYWFTGIPCSGKTTIMNKYIETYNKYTIQILDGDTFRKEVTPHLGFSALDREINLRTAFKIIKTLVNNGVIVFAGFVSPNKKIREEFKAELGNKFKEVFVYASRAECMKRDVKGMYKLAIDGKIKGFTGYDAPYDEPEKPDLIINTEEFTIKESIDLLNYFIKDNHGSTK